MRITLPTHPHTKKPTYNIDESFIKQVQFLDWCLKWGFILWRLSDEELLLLTDIGCPLQALYRNLEMFTLSERVSMMNKKN